MTAPELVVPGNPADWLPCSGCEWPSSRVLEHRVGYVQREWLAVKTLPRVLQHHETNGAHSVGDGPLRAGDTVTLRSPSPVNGCGDPVFGDPAPFAEATVAEVLPIVAWDDHMTPMPRVRIGLMGNTAHEHIDPAEGEVWPDIDLPDATPGGWAIRLTDVKETT